MNIEKIQIRNFRSIEDAELELMPRCRVLVGINESGKSNLLKAISSLGTFVPTRIDDAREPSPSEDPKRLFASHSLSRKMK
jgi:predicted ATP-dependent endonuclease of OLD family